MIKERNAVFGYCTERPKASVASLCVGQPIRRSNAVNIVLAGPVSGPVPDVAYLEPGILPQLALDGQVELIDIGRAVTQALAKVRCAKAAAEAGIETAAGCRRVEIVQESSMAVVVKGRNKRRVRSRRSIRQVDVIPVIELTKACPDCPALRAGWVPSHTDPRRKAMVELILYGAIRSLHAPLQP